MKCLACHKESNKTYHPRCLRNIFDVTYIPKISFGSSDIASRVSQTAGRMSISGVQIKASVKINKTTKQLEIIKSGGTHILKPEPTEYPELPQNENLIMNLAQALKLNTPPHGLFEMADKRVCYIIKRFDRSADSRKIHKEDMAQLLEKPTDAKYKGSLEVVGNIIKQHTENKLIELFEFFQRIIFNFIIGNGDMHLKNWSLLTPRDGKNKLAPCYDFVNSKMYLPREDESALTMRGKKNGWKRADFEQFAAYLGMDSKAATNAIELFIKFEPTMDKMIRDSFLSPDRQVQLLKIVRERIKRLI